MSSYDDLVKATIDSCEPAAAIDKDFCLTSIAISLKRIADAQDKMIEMYEGSLASLHSIDPEPTES